MNKLRSDFMRRCFRVCVFSVFAASVCRLFAAKDGCEESLKLLPEYESAVRGSIEDAQAEAFSTIRMLRNLTRGRRSLSGELPRKYVAERDGEAEEEIKQIDADLDARLAAIQARYAKAEEEIEISEDTTPTAETSSRESLDRVFRRKRFTKREPKLLLEAYSIGAIFGVAMSLVSFYKLIVVLRKRRAPERRKKFFKPLVLPVLLLTAGFGSTVFCLNKMSHPASLRAKKS